MGANIELWSYHLFENKYLYLEKVLQTDYVSDIVDEEGVSAKNPVMVAAGKKAAITRATGVYSFEQHLEDKSDEIRDLMLYFQEFILGIDSSIQEVPKKNYIAYKISQNIACAEVLTQQILLFLKLNPKEILDPPKSSRNMTGIHHHGTGDFEIIIKNNDDLESAKPFIEMAYHKVGG